MDGTLCKVQWGRLYVSGSRWLWEKLVMGVKERRGYRTLWRRDFGANGGNDGASCFMEMMDMREPMGRPIGEAKPMMEVWKQQHCQQM